MRMLILARLPNSFKFTTSPSNMKKNIFLIFKFIRGGALVSTLVFSFKEKYFLRKLLIKLLIFFKNVFQLFIQILSLFFVTDLYMFDEGKWSRQPQLIFNGNAVHRNKVSA